MKSTYLKDKKKRNLKLQCKKKRISKEERGSEKLKKINLVKKKESKTEEIT